MNDSILTSLLTAFSLGLLGSGHCLGMCGGIAGALSLGQSGSKRSASYSFLFSCGRILSYGIIGLLLGGLAQVAADTIKPVMGIMRITAGLLLIAMGLYLADWWRGLLQLEKFGSILWRHIQPVTRKLMPVRSPAAALGLGLLWGWLPCGLVYSTLIWSASSANALESGLLMVGFGLGTLPSMFGASFFSAQLARWLAKKSVKTTAAVLLILFGLWTMAMPLSHSNHAGSSEGSSMKDHNSHH
ncbi:MAG: sulfite exporter TauE/SafE family protein [Pseudomonadales bacterium]